MTAARRTFRNLESVMNKQRIQFEASEDTVKLIDDLMDKTDVTTRKEFLNNAISLMKWAIDKTIAGSTIAAVNEHDKMYRELQMPALMAAATKGQKTQANQVDNNRETAGAA